MSDTQLKRHIDRSGEAICDIAELAGITREYLSRIVNGRAVPSLDLAKTLHKITGISVNALTRGKTKCPLCGKEREE